MESFLVIFFLLIFVMIMMFVSSLSSASRNAKFEFNQNEFSQAGVVISFLDGSIKIGRKKYDINDVKTIDSWSCLSGSDARSITIYYANIETKNLNKDSYKSHRNIFNSIVKKFINIFNFLNLNNAPYKKHRKVFNNRDDVERFVKRFNFSLNKIKEYPQGQTYESIYTYKRNDDFSNCYEGVEPVKKIDKPVESDKVENESSQAETDLSLSNVNSYSDFRAKFISFLKFLGYPESNILCNAKIGEAHLNYLVSVPNSNKKLAIISIQEIGNDAVQIKEKLESYQQEIGYLVYLLRPSKETQSKYQFALEYLDNNGNFAELDIEELNIQSAKNIKTIPSKHIENNEIHAEPNSENDYLISKRSDDSSNVNEEIVEKIDKSLEPDRASEIEKNYRPSLAEIDEIEKKDENNSDLIEPLLFAVGLLFVLGVGHMFFGNGFVIALSLFLMLIFLLIK
ncbi:hypothetical protein QUF50_04060 [Thiotrichales bacterium HSG1]|nr:hypothetical protein [Thiotrichales bacterium HSG1]